MVRVRGLQVIYQQRNSRVNALEGVSFSLGRGETCAFIGPSGCGKTTLLYVLAGLLAPTQGEVAIAGQPVRPKRRETALILQDYGLFPWKTVWANTVLGLQLRRASRDEQARLGAEILQELGLWDFREHYPAQLSGGQRQRVAIARSLALDPDLLLMDEPFSSLDALTRENLQELLLEVWRKDGLTLVLVTHSIEEAVFLGQRIFILSPRPGTIIHEVANRGAGEPGYRRRPAYYEKCLEVRRLLEGGVQRASSDQGWRLA